MMRTTIRAARRLALPLAAMTLAACAGPQGAPGASGASGAPGGRAPAADAAGASVAAPSTAAPSSVARRGAYYLDDGPGANPAPDPASIPDAVPRAEELLPRAMRPYSVFGRQFTPMTRLQPFRERGTASWYGRRYHGQPTSSGERYDMYAMTAAHPTLPIPSYARVTHLGNGRSVVVRVNDRGPFLRDRVIDLSYTAAAKLGYVASGSAEVEVELITQFEDAAITAPPAAAPAAPPAAALATTPSAETMNSPGAAASAPPAPPRLNLETVYAANEPLRVEAPASPMPAAASRAQETAPVASARAVWLQLGAFGSLENARSAMAQLARRLHWLGAGFDIHQEGSLYKVQAGPWKRREQATAAAERIRAATDLRPFATLR